MKRPLEIGRARNGLYYLCSKCQFTSSTSHSVESHNVCNSCSVSTCKIPSSVSDCKHCDSMSNCPRSVDLITSSNKDTCCTTSNPIPISPFLVNSLCSHNKVIGSSNAFSICTSLSDTCIDYLWHNRLGHVPFVKMRSISSIPVSFASKQLFICTICPMAKQIRLPFPTNNSVSSKPFDLLHLDL